MFLTLPSILSCQLAGQRLFTCAQAANIIITSGLLLMSWGRPGRGQQQLGSQCAVLSWRCNCGCQDGDSVVGSETGASLSQDQNAGTWRTLMQVCAVPSIIHAPLPSAHVSGMPMCPCVQEQSVEMSQDVWEGAAWV